jgi:hypothetical protein
MKKHLLVVLLACICSVGYSQKIPRYNPDTLRTIVIDTPVANILSHRLNAQDFIDAMLAFNAENRVFTYDKKNKVDGKIYRKIHHSNNGSAHKMEFLAKRDSGAVFKKNGKYELYTVEMFDFIFMNAYNSDFVKSDAPVGNGKNEGYKAKLKTLVFTPGRRVSGIPFISGKTEIFGPELKQFYTYQFARGRYLDTIPVYRFRVLPKPSISDDDVMIKEVTTIFDARTMQILGRYIDMKFKNFLFSFNVQMNIECNNFNGELLPFHKEERASFLIVHKDYKRETNYK